MKFSVRGGKKEEEVIEKDLAELAQQITGETPEETPTVDEQAVSAYDEIQEKIEDIQARVEQLDSSSSALRSELSQFDERFNTIESNVRDLLSLYELATKNENPFFQSDNSEGAPSTPVAEEVAPPTQVVGDAGASVPVERQVQESPKEEGSPLSISPERSFNPDQPLFPPSTPSWQPSLHLGIPRDEEAEHKIVDELRSEDLDNSPTTNMLILRWIEYIMQKVGYTGLSSTLDYYAQIGWISRGAAAKIMSFSTGIDLYGSGAQPPKKSTLSVREHLVSLFFVTKLKKDKVFDNIYLSVKDEVEKLGLSLSMEGA